VTSAIPPQARRAAPGGGGSFRRWRRTRPFWGGLFVILGGAEIFGTTQMSLGGLTFQLGPTGFLSWLIPTILVACGMLLWFSPQQRLFYAIVAAVTALYSLIGVNLGGFFLGMLIALLGSAMGFAWTPLPQQPSPPPPPVPPAGGVGHHPDETQEIDYGGSHRRPAEPAPSTMDELFSGPMTDTLPPPRNPLRERDYPPVPEPPHRPEVPYQRPANPYSTDHPYGDPPAGSGGALPRRSPKLLAITLLALSLSATGAVMLRGTTPAQAEPCQTPPKPGATQTAPPPTKPEPTATPTPTPTAQPGAGEEKDGNPVGDFFHGIADGFRDLFGGGNKEEAPAAEPTPTVTPPADRKGTGQKPVGKPVTKPKAPAEKPGDGCGTPQDKPTKPAKQLAADEDQPPVQATPSKLTGSKVTMEKLKFEGVVPLPIKGGGTVRTLKFTMTNSVTTDFELRVPGSAGKATSLKSRTLTVEGDVQFYTSRFHATLLHIPVTFDPDHPPPPLPLDLFPITFGEPEIDLVYVQCATLKAPTLDIGLV
jgi:hypothetical protein